MNLRPDPWLTEMMGCPVYQAGAGEDLSRGEESVPISERLRKAPCFAYAKVQADRIRTVADLEDMGFRLIETSVILERAVEKGRHTSGERGVRFAAPEDEAGVRAVAGRSFVYSRFHLDPQVPEETAHRIKGEWAGNFFRGRRGDHMVVAVDGGAVAGFLQLMDRKPLLVIDLVAVAPESRRKGLASRMITFAENNLPGFTALRVGTQAANIPSLRLYGDRGFRVAEVNYVFHFHHPTERPA